MSDYSQRRDAAKAQRARQLRQDYAEVQALYQAKLAAGMTPAQAATSQGSLPTGSYTVKAGDNINTIAQNTGVNPQDILGANPDVTQIQTGMVLQTPPKKEAGFGAGGNPTLPTGQPNNPVTSASGALNPSAVQGSEAWRIQQQNSGTMSYKPPIPVTQQRPLRPGQAQQLAGTPPQTSYLAPTNPGRNVQGGGNMSLTPLAGLFQPSNPGRNVQGGGITTPAVQPTFGQPTTPAPQQTNYRSLPSHQTESRYVEDLFTRTQLGYTPNAGEMQYLIDTGRVTQTNQSQFTANGSYTIRRGGGGGGGERSGGKPIQTRAAAYQNNNLPAFSSGAGFGSLVNWRI